MLPRLAATLALVAALLACAPARKAVPLWGAALDGYPISAQMIAALTEKTQQPAPQIVVFFLQWPPPGGADEFPLSSLEAIWTAGALPCITWEPFTVHDGQERMIPYTEIIGGAYDAYIAGFAARAASWGKPLIIRFGHEMNLSRYHWGTSPADYGRPSPAIYRQMFAYVHAIFQKAGAGNVLWAFCPNADSVPHPERDPGAGWNLAAHYYPGDDRIDILGMDGYNWGTTQTTVRGGWQSRWLSFEDLFAALYAELKSMAAAKPVMVFETASATAGGNKTEWVRGMIETARRWDIQGVVWFQVNKEIDWRLGTGLDPAALADLAPLNGAAQRWAQTLIDGRRRRP